MGPGSGSLRNPGTGTLVSTQTVSLTRPTAQFVHHRLAHGHGAASLGQLERKCLAIPCGPSTAIRRTLARNRAEVPKAAVGQARLRTRFSLIPAGGIT